MEGLKDATAATAADTDTTPDAGTGAAPVGRRMTIRSVSHMDVCNDCPAVSNSIFLKMWISQQSAARSHAPVAAAERRPRRAAHGVRNEHRQQEVAGSRSIGSGPGPIKRLPAGCRKQRPGQRCATHDKRRVQEIAGSRSIDGGPGPSRRVPAAAAGSRGLGSGVPCVVSTDRRKSNTRPGSGKRLTSLMPIGPVTASMRVSSPPRMSERKLAASDEPQIALNVSEKSNGPPHRVDGQDRRVLRSQSAAAVHGQRVHHPPASCWCFGAPRHQSQHSSSFAETTIACCRLAMCRRVWNCVQRVIAALHAPQPALQTQAMTLRF